MTDFTLSRFSSLLFPKFSDQDIDGLSDIFDDLIILKDWDICCNSKIPTLQAVKDIYTSVTQITVEPLDILIDITSNSSACF